MKSRPNPCAAGAITILRPRESDGKLVRVAILHPDKLPPLDVKYGRSSIYTLTTTPRKRARS